jgi:hypothetical protein
MDWGLAFGLLMLVVVSVALIALAWVSDSEPYEPTEHGDTPL